MPETKKQWPLYVWGMQLFPAGFILSYALWRLVSGFDASGNESRSYFILSVGLFWLAATIVPLLWVNGRSWLVTHRMKWGLSAATLIVCLVACDIGLTVLGIVPTIAEQRAYSFGHALPYFSNYRLVPKTILVEGGSPAHINKRGYRGPEIAPVKPDGTIRIVFLGGSQVFDFRGGGWPNMAGEELRRLGHHVDIVNAGSPGNNSTGSLKLMIEDLWVLRPDVVVFCHTWNDIKYFRRLTEAAALSGLPPEEPRSWRRDWRVYPSGWDRIFSASAFYRKVRWGLVKFLITEEGRRRPRMEADSQLERRPFGPLGPRQFELSLKLIADLTQEIGAKLVVCKQACRVNGTGISGSDLRSYVESNVGVSIPELENGYEACNRAIERIATERGLLLIDMNQEMSNHVEYFWDSIHFSPDGSRAAAKLITDVFHAKLFLSD